MKNNKLRYDYIDNAKGVALLLVISWHCNFSFLPSAAWSEWVLPFFFIIVGCFYKHNLSLKELIVKKANGLLVPWVLLSIPAVLLAIFHVKGFEFNKLYNPYKCILGPCWFLICTFWCYLIFWCINELTNRFARKHVNEWLLLSVIILFSLSWSMNYINIKGHRLVLPFFLSAALTCSIFVGIGYYFRKRILETPLSSVVNVIMIVVSVIVCYLIVKVGGGKSFNPMWNETDQPVILAVVCAVFGSYIVLQLCRLIPNIFAWIGKNTIPLLCIHYYPTELLLYYMPKMNSGLRYLIVLMVSLPLTYLISYVLPIVNGKGKVIRLRYENS